MAANRIYVQVDFQTGQAGAAINQLNQGIRQIGGAAQSASSQATGSLRGVSVQVEQMSRQFDRAKAALLGLVTGGAGAGLLRLTSDFQRAQITMTQMTGSAEAARKTLTDLRALSQQQPFEFQDLQNLTTSLSAFGFQGQELLRTVKAVADSAAGVGGTVEKLNQIGLAIGQIKVKGRLNAEEINKQLGEAGIAASRYLAEELSRQTKKTATPGDVMMLAELQRLDANVGLQVILRGMEKQFGGLGASTTSNVIGSQFSKLADAAKFAAVELGEAFTPAARKAVDGLRGMIDYLAPALKSFRELPEPVRNTTAAIIALTAALTILPSVLSLFSFLPANLARAAAAFTTLRTVVTAVLTGMTGALVGSEATLLRFGKAIAVVGAAFAGWKMGEWLRENVGPLKEFSNWLQDSVWAKLGFASNRDAEMGQQADRNLTFAIGKMEEAMRRRGMQLPSRGSLGDSEYSDLLRETMRAGAKQDEEIKADLLKANEVAIKAAVDGARAKLEQTRRQLAVGLFKIEPEYAEAFKSARDAGAGEAIRLLRQSVAVEVERERSALFGGRITGPNGKPGPFVFGSWQQQLAEQMDSQRETFAQRVLAPRAERFSNRLGLSGEAMQIAQSADMDRLRRDEEAINHSRDLQLQSLERIQAVTVAQKIALEQQKFAIETAADQKLLEHKKRMLELEFNGELLLLEARLRAAGTTEDQISAIRVASWQRYSATVDGLDDEFKRTQEKRAQDLSVTSTQLIIDQQRRAYDSLKGGAEKVFDALLNRSQNVFTAIGNAFKVAVLTAIREIVTSRVAASLMELFGLGQVSFVPGGGQLGGSPVFGGARTGGGLAGLAGMLGLGGFGSLTGGLPGVMIPGAPGGTGGFAGPVGSVSGNAAPGATTGGAGGLLGAAGGLAGFGSLLFNSGSIALGGGAATTAAGIGGVKGALAGIGTSSAALLAGPLLMMAGYQSQNKALKFGLTTGGGLLTGLALGAKIGSIGGPMGAAIGAAIGAGIGLISMLRKTPEQKAREAIRATYSVDVWDKGLLGQVAQTAKSAFGGNYMLAVQSPQIRELIQLWSQMTGQKVGGMPPQAQPLTLMQSGGSLYQQPGFANGMPMPLVGGGVIAAGTAQNAPLSVVIHLDGAATTDLLRGEAVQAIAENPRAAQSAVLSATRSNAGRREFLSLQLAPGTVTS
jgi:tape measure domain-containing protein